MRAWSVIPLLVFVTLSGCSSSGGLNAYLMNSAEAPASCSLMPYDSEEGQFLKEAFNWTGNPGSVDNEVFEEDGIQPEANMVALYECDEGEVASLALRFATPEQAANWADFDDFDPEDCGEEPFEGGVVNGPVVAFVEGDDEVPGMQDSLETWLLRMQGLGAQDPCAAAGNQTA